MIFLVEKELRRLFTRIVLFMECSRQWICAKQNFMVFALQTWLILTLCGDIEEIRKDMQKKLSNLMWDWDIY